MSPSRRRMVPCEIVFPGAITIRALVMAQGGAAADASVTEMSTARPGSMGFICRSIADFPIQLRGSGTRDMIRLNTTNAQRTLTGSSRTDRTPDLPDSRQEGDD